MTIVGTRKIQGLPTARGTGVGQRHFGRFVLLKRLGCGGMGEVWLARDERDAREVALKLLAEPFRWDISAIADLKEEACKMCDLSHPGIVQMYELVEDDLMGVAIVMEYVNGRTLNGFRLEQPSKVLDPLLIVPWLSALCSALDYAHARANLVHLDIKPSNLILSTDGRIKLADFGVARCLARSANHISSYASCGTFAYMSPQQIMGESPHPSDDIYSLGATLYELLAGRPPFETGDIRAQIKRRPAETIANKRRILGVSGETLPLVWEQTIAACLAKRPENRPKTAGEIARRLAHGAGRCQGARFPFLARSRGFWIAGISLLGVAVWIGCFALHNVAFFQSAASGSQPLRQAAAAWNFDGDGRENGEADLQFEDGPFVPVANRWGQIDRALIFNGNAGLRTRSTVALNWIIDQPFSAGVWVRLADFGENNAVIFCLREESASAPRLLLGAVGGRFYIERGIGGGSQARLFTADRMASDKWTHVLAMYGDSELKLYIDGELAGRQIWQDHGKITPAGEMTFYVATDGRSLRQNFVGSLDSLRLWKRSLTALEIARQSSAQPGPRFMPTKGITHDEKSIFELVVAEYGVDAQVADWRELSRWHADDIRAVIDEWDRTPVMADVLVQCDQRQFSAPSFQYLIRSSENVQAADFIVHDTIGKPALTLGSARLAGGRVLAKKTGKVFGPVEFQSTAECQTLNGSLPKNLSALSITWIEKAPVSDIGNLREVQLLLRNGRKVGVRLSAGEPGMLALSMGDFSDEHLSRQVAASRDAVEFTLVMRRDRLEFRCVQMHGYALLFRSVVPKLGFDVSEVDEVLLAGVASARWVAEN